MPCRILGVWAPSSTLAHNHGRTCMGSGSGTNGFRCPIQVPWGPSAGPRPPDWPKKYNPTGPRFGRTSPTCALTPRIGLPERIPAPGCGIQLQGQFSHPWGTPGRGYDPRRGHLGLAEAPNLNAFTPCSTSGAHTCAAISGLLHSRKPLLMGRTPTRPPPASLRVHPAQLWVSPSTPCGMRCETWWMVWGRLVRDAVALMDPELAVVHW